METPRSMSWKEFKESLGNMVGKRIMYIDEEGTEIPINTDTEFQEALRLAKRQGNRVRFVLVNESYDEGRKSGRQNSKSKDKNAYKDAARHSKVWVNDTDYKEVKEAVYVNDAPPEWFLTYMKKFKKDLLAEVNNTIHDTVRKAFKKEVKTLLDERLAKDYEWENDMNCVGTQYYYRSDGGYETPAYFVTSQPLPASGSVRMRSTEKVCFDQMKDDRRGKQYSKIEKGRLALDKRQKQDKWMNVPTVGQEEKYRASKSRAYPKVYVTYVHDFGPIKPMKSASFTSNLSLKRLEVLQPYALWFLLGNNGSVPWSNNAYVKCFYNPDEFEFEDNVIELPSLDPGVGANVVYEVTPLKVGFFSFTCAIIDNGAEIGERILCRFEVVNEEGMRTYKATKVSAKKEVQLPCEHFDEEFTKTQKKIRENIKTIMKRLDDIEVLNSDSSSKKKDEDAVKVGQKRNRKKRKEGSTIEFRTGVFDLLQNLESIRENEEGKPKDDEKEMVKDALVGTEDKGEDEEKQIENGKVKSQEDDGSSDCNQSTKDDSKNEATENDRRDSDSELSVIMGSEEDDNFIVLSMPSRTPSPETEVKDLENDQDKTSDKDIEKEKVATPNDTPREEEKKTTFESNIFDPWNEKKNRESTRFDPWNEKKSQTDPFDDAPKDNDKKKKWGGVHVLNIPPVCFVDKLHSPAEVLAKLKNNASMIHKDGVFYREDKLGRKIVFVVDKVGKCVPVVDEKLKEGAGAEKRQETPETKENRDRESQGESSDDSPSEGSPSGSEQPKESTDRGSSPNLLLYNAASDAITRVASVFNSIHSAFLPAGTGKKTQAVNNIRPLRMMEALEMLEDMGFKDRIRNRELLMVHNLNMVAVVEDLLDKTPNFRDNPPTGIFLSKQGIFGRM